MAKPTTASFIPKPIKTVTLGFSLIFSAYVASERYVTAYFASLGEVSVAFTALLILYGVYMLTMLVSARILDRIGLVRAMWMGATGYIFFIAMLAFGSVPLLYFASVILGVCAALVWPAQTAYFVANAPSKHRGAVGGWFSTRQSLARLVGIIVITFLISWWSYRVAFAVFAVLPLAGLFVLWRVPPMKQKQAPAQPVQRLLRAPTVFAIAAPILCYYIVYGVVVSLIPITVQATYGVRAVGWFLAMLFAVPMVIAYPIGVLVDKLGLRAATAAFVGTLLLALIAILCVPGIAGALIGGLIIATAVSGLAALQLRLLAETGTPATLALRNSSGWLFATTGTLVALGIARSASPHVAYGIAAAITFVLGSLAVYTLSAGLPEVRRRTQRELTS